MHFVKFNWSVCILSSKHILSLYDSIKISNIYLPPIYGTKMSIFFFFNLTVSSWKYRYEDSLKYYLHLVINNKNNYFLRQNNIPIRLKFDYIHEDILTLP